MERIIVFIVLGVLYMIFKSFFSQKENKPLPSSGNPSGSGNTSSKGQVSLQELLEKIQKQKIQNTQKNFSAPVEKQEKNDFSMEVKPMTVTSMVKKRPDVVGGKRIQRKKKEEYEHRQTKRRTGKYSNFFKNKESVRDAFIMSEIFNRKF